MSAAKVFIFAPADKEGATHRQLEQAGCELVLGKASWETPLGDNEAEMMAHCETIVMVINNLRPSFTSLAETGWAALGAVQRGQHFILQVDENFTYELPAPLRQAAGGAELEEEMRHYTTSSRYLVLRHARYFKHDRLHLMDDINGVIAQLRAIYAPPPPRGCVAAE